MQTEWEMVDNVKKVEYSVDRQSQPDATLCIGISNVLSRKLGGDGESGSIRFVGWALFGHQLE